MNNKHKYIIFLNLYLCISNFKIRTQISVISSFLSCLKYLLYIVCIIIKYLNVNIALHKTYGSKLASPPLYDSLSLYLSPMRLSMKSLALLSCFLLLTLSLLIPNSSSFQSDELLIEDDEFIKSPDLGRPSISSPTRKTVSDSGSDSKVQFVLEHAFGDSEFTPAGTFSARLKTWSHGGQVALPLLDSIN